MGDLDSAVGSGGEGLLEFYPVDLYLKHRPGEAGGCAVFQLLNLDCGILGVLEGELQQLLAPPHFLLLVVDGIPQVSRRSFLLHRPDGPAALFLVQESAVSGVVVQDFPVGVGGQGLGLHSVNEQGELCAGKGIAALVCLQDFDFWILHVGEGHGAGVGTV